MTTYESPLAQAIIDACNAAGGADDMADVFEGALHDESSEEAIGGLHAVPTVVMAALDFALLADAYGGSVPKAPRVPRDLIVPDLHAADEGWDAPSSEIRPVVGARAAAITAAPPRRFARR